MPILRSGNFTLYGFSLTNPSTLTLGESLAPPATGQYVLCNSGNVVYQPDIPTPMPCDPSYLGPAWLDTSADGTHWPAGAPPPGFTLHTRPIYTGPMLRPGPVWIYDVNNAGVFRMGGKSGVPITHHTFNGSSIAVEQDDPLLTYIELLDALQFHITRVDGSPFVASYWGRGGAPSPAPPSPGSPSPGGASITGGYDIVIWWWTVQTTDACGNRHQQRHTLSTTQPPNAPDGGVYEKLDPADVDAHPTPVVLTVTPSHGQAGLALEIAGEGFGEAATVTIGGVAATAVVVVHAALITCIAPAHALGLTTVVVTNADGVSS